jgi:hypothetical protein
LASLYTDATLTTTLSNPLTADSKGNFYFYVSGSAAPLTVQIYGKSVSTYVMTDQTPGISPIGNLSFKTVNNVLFADQFPGSDIGEKINNAYMSLPTGGGTIVISAGVYSYSTPINLSTNAKPVILSGMGNTSTILQYTPTTGVALTLNPGQVLSYLPSPTIVSSGVRDLSLVAVNGPGTATGMVVGGTLGVSGGYFENVLITGFNLDLQLADHDQSISFVHCFLYGGNQLISASGNSSSGETIAFYGCQLSNAVNHANAIYIDGTGDAFIFQVSFIHCSFDYGAQVYVKAANVRILGGHAENADNNYFFIADANARLSIIDTTVDSMSTFSSAIVHALAGSQVNIINLIGALSQSQAYSMVTADSGSRVSIVGGSTLNVAGWWNNQPWTGTGKVTFYATATTGDMPSVFPSGSVTTIDLYPGAVVTDRLNSCLSAASTSTLTCDARSLTGSLSGTSFTIPDNTALLLGNVTLLLSPGAGNFAVTMGNNSRLEGMAPGFGSVVSPTRLRIQNSAGHGIHFKCTTTNPCTTGSTTQAPIIRNIELNNQNATNTGIGIDWSGVQHGEFSNVWVHQWGIASLCNSTAFTASENGFYNFFSNDLTGTEVGLVVQGTCNSNNWFNPHIIVSSSSGSKAIQFGSTSGTQPNENSFFGATLESGVAGTSTALNVDGGSELRMFGGRFEGFATALATNGANCTNILRVVLDNPRFIGNTTNISNSCTQVEVRGVRAKGTATLASGSATVTFTPSYQVAPTCQCTDTTSAAAVKCTPTASSLSIAGTGTDVVSYVCEGNPN